MKVWFHGHDVIGRPADNPALEVRFTRVGNRVPLDDRSRVLDIVLRSVEPWRAATLTFYNGVYAAYVSPQWYYHAFIEYAYRPEEDEVLVTVERTLFSYYSFFPAMLLCYDDAVGLMFRLEYPGEADSSSGA
jgi:hypothetical protein